MSAGMESGTIGLCRRSSGVARSNDFVALQGLNTWHLHVVKGPARIRSESVFQLVRQ
jgi:hypothetical protein